MQMPWCLMMNSLKQKIHKKYKSNNIDAKTSWTQQAKFDVAFYKSKGLNVDDFKKILRILE